ncbi:MAG TPA: hypothetical protein VEV41_27375 [Terriglobales bacterium]|nr:hypothetical protein [Terriglobales bacterium]
MKGRIFQCIIFALAALLAAALMAQSPSPGPGLSKDKFDYNPQPFDKFGVSPSEVIRWGLSKQGMKVLAGSNQNNAQMLFRLGGGTVSAQGNTSPNRIVNLQTRQGQGNCGVQFGTKFNLEPATGDPNVNLYASFDSFFGGTAVLTVPLPQDEEAVDFIPNAGQAGSDVIVEGHNDYRGFFGALNSSVTGVTVHVANLTGATDCTPSYEMGVPQVASPLNDGDVLLGSGDPIVVANPTNGNIYVGDLQFGFFDTAVGVFKTTAATLSSPCQALGTTNEGNSTACLPVNVMVNTQNEFSSFLFNDKPHMAVDERPSGTGAGDVYVTDTQFSLFTGTSEIGLEACSANLVSCSSYQIVSDTTESGGFPQDQFSNIHVRRDGGISITYVSVNFNFNTFPFSETFDIKYVSCTPNGAPNFPTCSPAQRITTEARPLDFGGVLASNLFRVTTYPTHDNRDDSRGTRTYVVWAGCNQAPTNFTLAFEFVCPNADLRYAFANTTGNPAAPTWKGPFTFDASAGDQIMPWVRTDATRGIVNVAYYTGADDPLYRHKYRATMRQISPGSDTPSPPNLTAILSVDPSGDFNFQNLFIGDYIGVAGRAIAGGASNAYVAFTYNNDPGVLPNDAGTAATVLTEENNHLTIVKY